MTAGAAIDELALRKYTDPIITRVCDVVKWRGQNRSTCC